MMERASAVDTGLYDQDFALWVKAQVNVLRSGRLSAVDIKNVIKELEALAKRDRREIKNRLRVLGAHLLKRRYQQEIASRSWDATVLEQSARIISVLEDSPSLAREVPGLLLVVYAGAAALARAETGLTTIPVWPDEQFVLDWCTAIGQTQTEVLSEARRKFAERRSFHGAAYGAAQQAADAPDDEPAPNQGADAPENEPAPN